MTRPRDLSTRLWRCGRLSLVFEPRDIWLGVYVAPGAVYACLVPCFPLKWERRKVSVIRCAGTPYRCDGFDPKDWPDGKAPDFSLVRA